MNKPFRIGFVGIGIMGAPSVRRLRQRGWGVTVWNLEAERFAEVEASGAKWAESPAAVRAASDVIIICVLGDHAIESVCLGPNGLTAGQGANIVIDLSTTSPRMTTTLIERTKFQWLDCPVSGGPGAAESGTLTMMAGGSDELFARVKPILDDLAGNLTLMGSSCAGQTTKIINQAIVGSTYLVVAEALAMARAAGIDGLSIASALKGGAADSTILQTIFKQMVCNDFDPPRSRAKQLNKDMHSVAEFSAQHGLTLPLQDATVRQFQAYVDQGGGESDSASVALLYV
jgi:3-hydroxyisobutyrate dehydrogenase-like beta-hydroxyacid dehydrogenase